MFVTKNNHVSYLLYLYRYLLLSSLPSSLLKIDYGIIQLFVIYNKIITGGYMLRSILLELHLLLLKFCTSIKYNVQRT